MPPKPKIAMTRPSRNAISDPVQTKAIAQTAIPEIDTESPAALAYSMQGRSSSMSNEIGKAASHLSGSGPLHPPIQTPPTRNGVAEWTPSLDPLRPYSPAGDEFSQPLISIKLPPEVGRQLAAIADRRGSKRTLVAIEALSEPLRALAAAHRAGGFPDLPRIVSGTVRSSISFALPANLGEDLEYVLKTRRAVKAQVVTRLLAPAVRALYDSELGPRAS